MSFTLGDEDRRAVDMLLDRDGTPSGSNGNGGDGGGTGHANAAAARDGQFHQRIERVEQILSLLSNMPASEPPENLVMRVLERIVEDPARISAPSAVPQPAIHTTRPLA